MPLAGPNPTRSAIRIAAAVLAAATIASPAAAQRGAAASLAVASGPGHVTAPIPLTRYAVTGLPNGAVAASDAAEATRAGGATPGARFVTSEATGPAVAAIEAAASSHATIAEIVLDHVAIGGRIAHVVLADCSVVTWTESGSGHAGTLRCAQAGSTTQSTQPGAPAGFDLKQNHSGR